MGKKHLIKGINAAAFVLLLGACSWDDARGELSCPTEANAARRISGECATVKSIEAFSTQDNVMLQGAIAGYAWDGATDSILMGAAAGSHGGKQRWRIKVSIDSSGAERVVVLNEDLSLKPGQAVRVTKDQLLWKSEK